MQAVLITAYKNYFHLEELVDFFDENYNIYIHIDKKSKITKEEEAKLSSRVNVKFISRQYKINWGGVNHLNSILLLCKRALHDNKNEYFHLITGHDYPIKSLDVFSDFFSALNGKDFMEYHPLPYEAWEKGGFDRLEKFNFYDLVNGRNGIGKIFINKIAQFQKIIGFKRKYYDGFPDLYGGSTYWSLRRETLEYVFKYMKENPRFLNRFKYSFCSEEIFFQTVLLNSPLRENIINNHKRFIVWEERNGNFPANLDDSDYRNITETDAFFARKFEYPVSGNLFEKVKENFTKK